MKNSNILFLFLIIVVVLILGSFYEGIFEGRCGRRGESCKSNGWCCSKKCAKSGDLKVCTR
jgi:hypothetical protein